MPLNNRIQRRLAELAEAIKSKTDAIEAAEHAAVDTGDTKAVRRLRGELKELREELLVAESVARKSEAKAQTAAHRAAQKAREQNAREVERLVQNVSDHVPKGLALITALGEWYAEQRRLEAAAFDFAARNGASSPRHEYRESIDDTMIARALHDAGLRSVLSVRGYTFGHNGQPQLPEAKRRAEYALKFYISACLAVPESEAAASQPTTTRAKSNRPASPSVQRTSTSNGRLREPGQPGVTSTYYPPEPPPAAPPPSKKMRIVRGGRTEEVDNPAYLEWARKHEPETAEEPAAVPSVPAMMFPLKGIAEAAAKERRARERREARAEEVEVE
jgi:hypothetical protein